MRTETPELLPKILPGTVCAQWVRCGKPGCKCARGELHGPYYYRFWREDGRLRKAYVPRDKLDATRAACEAHRRQKQAAKESLVFLREARALARRAEQEIAGL